MQAGGIVVERDLMAPARDGVMLATDIYRPEGSGPFPVLLERTPYDKSAPSRSERTASDPTPRSREEVAAYFVAHGYAVAYQDCRGRYRSGGKFTKYLSEAEDGVDTLAWLMRQPWCDGHIGTFGLSYAAHTQAALGVLDPPGLAAQFLDCGGFSNAYRSGIRHGGAFDLKQATWAYPQRARRRPRPGRPARRSRRRTSLHGSAGCRGPGGIRRSAPPPNTRSICSNSGRMASSTITGSSPASGPRAFTTVMRQCRSCICRAGTIPTRAPQPTTMSACRVPGAVRNV